MATEQRSRRRGDALRRSRGHRNVDFTNGENGTVVTVHVSRSDDGMYTVHLMPMCNEDQIRVELQREMDLAIIEPGTSRPV